MLNHKLSIVLASSTILFIVGCGPQLDAPDIKPIVKDTNTTKTSQNYTPPPPRPKKKIKLKKVEDENFSSEYMYPEAKKKKEKPVVVAKTDTTDLAATAASTDNSMNRGECIAMIGQDKFDKYTQMLGDEASAIKRCKMLKAM